MAGSAKKGRGTLPAGFLAQAGKGRPKGVTNKATALAKDAIAQAAEGLGGAARIIAWAKEDEANERVFWSQIYTKLIPVQTELTGKDGAPIEINQANEDADAFRRRLLSGLVAGATAAGTSETVN
jgi:hypothetical protein